MNSLLTNPAEFGALLQRFFAERLIQQQNVSPRTVAAYRDTFRLLVNYAGRASGKPPAALALSDIDATLVLGFLTYLEAERHNTVRTRNARLAAAAVLFQLPLWADLATPVAPSTAPSVGDWIGLIEGYIKDGGLVLGLAIAVLGFLWIAYLGFAKFNEARQGKAEWAEVGVWVSSVRSC